MFSGHCFRSPVGVPRSWVFQIQPLLGGRSVCLRAAATAALRIPRTLRAASTMHQAAPWTATLSSASLARAIPRVIIAGVANSLLHHRAVARPLADVHPL